MNYGIYRMVKKYLVHRVSPAHLVPEEREETRESLESANQDLQDPQARQVHLPILTRMAIC